MELNKEELQRVLSMDDGKLREIIAKITEAVGADKKKAEALTRDLDGIKSSLAKMTPADAEKLINMAGKDKSEQIYRIIKGDNYK